MTRVIRGLRKCWARVRETELGEREIEANLRRQADDNFVELSARIESELAVSWGIKASIEGRALGLFALNLGVVTLYLAMSDGLKLSAPDATSFYYWVLWVSLGTAAISLVLALIAVWPTKYSVLPTGLLWAAYRHAQEQDTVLLPDLIPERLATLRSLRKANTAKALWSIWSMVAAGVSVFGFGLTVVGAVIH